MNAITDARAATPAPLTSAHAPSAHALKRAGQRALRFEGWQIVEAIGVSEPATLHYDLRVFRTTRGRIVVELVARRAAVQAPDLCRVEAFGDLGQAASWLESYPTSDDIPVPAGLACPDTPLATAALQAVRLRQCAMRVREEFNLLLSDVFAALGVAEALESPEDSAPA